MQVDPWQLFLRLLVESGALLIIAWVLLALFLALVIALLVELWRWTRYQYPKLLSLSSTFPYP